MGYQWLGRMPYLSKTRHGLYRYRRVIPPALREVAGRREWVKSLGTRDPKEAKKLWAAVNLEFEQCLTDLETAASAAGDQVPLDVQQRLASAFLKKHNLTYVPLDELRKRHEEHGNLPEPSEFEKRLSLLEEEEDIPVDDEHDRDEAIEKSLIARMVLGTVPPPKYLLTEAKRDYFAEKGYDLADHSRSADRRHRLLVERVISRLIEIAGEEASVEDLTRNHAIQYRDDLLAEGKAPTTAKKYVGAARAVLQVAIFNRELAKANPFHGLPVNSNAPTRPTRLPLTSTEIGILLDRRERMNSDLSDILTLLVHTGARLAEISGLAMEDFEAGSDDVPAHIHIRPNSIRRVKNGSSIRQVPLVADALTAVKVAVERMTEPVSSESPLFPRYGYAGGSDAASAALMKSLRAAGITDKRKVIHSLRHSMKDALRAVECPEDIRDAIQGHSRQTVAASYGAGHTLETKRKWLNKVSTHFLSDLP